MNIHSNRYYFCPNPPLPGSHRFASRIKGELSGVSVLGAQEAYGGMRADFAARTGKPSLITAQRAIDRCHYFFVVKDFFACEGFSNKEKCS